MRRGHAHLGTGGSMRISARAVATLAAAGSAALLAAAPPAGAAGSCSESGLNETTCVYATSGEDTFAVPDGVTSLRVVAVGGHGGTSSFNTIGGAVTQP